MNLGRVQQCGAPFDVYAHPANRMVADFMGLVNLVPGKVRDRSGAGGTIEIAPELGGQGRHARCIRARRRRRGRDPPEHPHRRAAARPATPAKIANHIFLGNISEYFAALPSGLTLRVQTHTRCSSLRSARRLQSRWTPRSAPSSVPVAAKPRRRDGRCFNKGSVIAGLAPAIHLLL